MKLSTTNKLNTQQYTHTPHTITIIIYTFNCLLLICSMRKKAKINRQVRVWFQWTLKIFVYMKKFHFLRIFYFLYEMLLRHNLMIPIFLDTPPNITFNSTIQKHRNENSTKFDVPYTHTHTLTEEMNSNQPTNQSDNRCCKVPRVVLLWKVKRRKKPKKQNKQIINWIMKNEIQTTANN